MCHASHKFIFWVGNVNGERDNMHWGSSHLKGQKDIAVITTRIFFAMYNVLFLEDPLPS